MTRSADFERALARPACARSAHFAVHFVPLPGEARPGPVAHKLSTEVEQGFTQAVDESVACSLDGAPAARLLGAVVPKRFARRAVTRTLLKRQIREAAARRVKADAPPGLWIVRLRAPFERARYPSAASGALRDAARGELDAVLDSAATRVGRAAPSP